MNPYQKAVEDFHQATGQTVGHLPDVRDAELRAKLILEEAVETAAALGYMVTATISDPLADYQTIARFSKEFDRPNLVEVIDGVCDLLYVTFGTAVAGGYDVDPFFWEVHRSNMDKLSGPKREDGKQLKPLDWKPPAIAELLENADECVCRH